MKYFSLICAILLASACNEDNSNVDRSEMIAEVRKVEKDFAAMAAAEGLAEAFSHYAAEDGVISRGKNLHKGPKAIRAYFEANKVYTDVSLTWEPDFIDVSKSGDMAYTYGPYTFTAKDSTGFKLEDTGYFHTVWKRQENGEWKFVWD